MHGYKHCIEYCIGNYVALETAGFCLPRDCRAMLCISAAYVVMRCLSVCVSVTFVYCVKMNKDIFIFFTVG